jgi:hypothetical protein
MRVANPHRYQQVQANVPEPKKQPEAKAEAKDAPRDAHVSISLEARRLQARAVIVNRLLVKSEDTVSPGGQELFERAGKSEHAQASASAVDFSPEATADRILEGVTGYIYGAFKLQNPDATAEDFETFAAQVTEGFERGAEEAREILLAFAAPGEDPGADVDRIVDLVHEGLEAFISEEGEVYASPESAPA